MRKGHHWFREYYEAILVAVIFTLFARTFVAQAFKIPTGSMEDNLLVGDHLFVNKFIYAPHLETPFHRLLPYRDIERGDVVVFKYPQEPERDFIKRAVAVEGDTIELLHKQLYVNGEPENNPYAVHKDEATYRADAFVPEDRRRRDNFGPYRVPDGFVFGMGDNRDNSYDSRFWGPIPRHYFKGRALIIYWSYDDEPNAHEWHGWSSALGAIAKKIFYFIPRTRWSRTFDLVH